MVIERERPGQRGSRLAEQRKVRQVLGKGEGTIERGKGKGGQRREAISLADDDDERG